MLYIRQALRAKYNCGIMHMDTPHYSKWNIASHTWRAICKIWP